MANHHDHSYKLLFSHPEMIRDLLTGFVKEEWVAQLDFSTLEKVSGSYVTDALRDREVAVLGSLVDWLKAPEQTSLRRAFVVWIRCVLLPNRAPGMELPEFNDLQDSHEVHDMLAERIKKWPERWEEKGRQEGRQEGEIKAKRETACNLIRLGVLSNEQIAEATGLPEMEIQALRAEARH